MDQITIMDVATALSHINRFTGHTIRPYSVAAHSLTMMQNAPRGLQYEALMHDAHEAVLGDISTPLKRMLGQEIVKLDRRLTEKFAETWGYSADTPPEIRELDLIMCATEAIQTGNGKRIAEWGLPLPEGFDILKDWTRYPILSNLSPEKCRLAFLDAFYILCPVAKRRGRDFVYRDMERLAKWEFKTYLLRARE
jgi:hypothetical protein